MGIYQGLMWITGECPVASWNPPTWLGIVKSHDVWVWQWSVTPNIATCCDHIFEVPELEAVSEVRVLGGSEWHMVTHAGGSFPRSKGSCRNPRSATAAAVCMGQLCSQLCKCGPATRWHGMEINILNTSIYHFNIIIYKQMCTYNIYIYIYYIDIQRQRKREKERGTHK